MRNKKSRFIYMILVGIAVAILLNVLFSASDYPHNRYYDFFISIFITLLVWEGNLRIDSIMNRRFPWATKPAKRILIHFPVSVIFSTIAIYIPMVLFHLYVCEMPNERGFMLTTIIIGILISVIVLVIEVSSQFFTHWKKSMIEAEKYKTESVQAQLQNLKNQINPHFLFNNMSVLSYLVYKDQDKAVNFINQLSKVYRYLLDNRSNELVSVEEELTFIESYDYLLQIRFDKNIIFNSNIPEKALKLFIPPMSIQMLIENAIKHNEISEASPLTISIHIEEDKLVVTNTLQLRNMPEASSKSGLQNIRDRYSYYTEKKVEVVTENKSFTVKIPLLNSK